MRNGHAPVLFSGGQDPTHLPSPGRCSTSPMYSSALTTVSATMSNCRHARKCGCAARRFSAGTRARGGSHDRPGRAGQISDIGAHAPPPSRWIAAGLPNTFVRGAQPAVLPAGRRRGLPARTVIRWWAACARDRLLGYPDRRDDTPKAPQVAVSLGMGQRFTIETPPMVGQGADLSWRAILVAMALVDTIISSQHLLTWASVAHCTPGDTAFRGHCSALAPAHWLRALAGEDRAHAAMHNPYAFLLILPRLTDKRAGDSIKSCIQPTRGFRGPASIPWWRPMHPPAD